MSGKLILEAEGVTFPIDKSACEFSEKLKKEFEDRESRGDFTESVKLGISRKQLPLIVAYINSLKVKSAEIIIEKGGEEESIELTVTPFQKIVKECTVKSSEFKKIMEFDNEFKVKYLKENIAFFVYLQLKGKSTEDMVEILGVKNDWNEVADSTRDSIRKEIEEAR